MYSITNSLIFISLPPFFLFSVSNNKYKLRPKSCQ
nr:MAG TPA: hypothetical protein [Caudoviricetes sp.]